MSINKQVLYNLIDNADKAKYYYIFEMLLKCIPEDNPLPDEIAAIKAGRESIRREGVIRHEDIVWPK